MIKINQKIQELALQAEIDLKEKFEEVDKICFTNSQKVLKAFTENKVSYSDFQDINGYGFYDGREGVVEKDDIPRLLGYLRAAPHGDADIRLLYGRRVV